MTTRHGLGFAVISLIAFSLFPAKVHAGLSLGFHGGAGIYSPTEDFHKSVGKGRTSGRDGIPVNGTAYRNHSTDLPAFAGGTTLGISARGRFVGLGVDLKGRYVYALGHVSKMTNPSTASDLIVGRSEYHHLELDVGLRLYFLNFFYFRPHYGIVNTAIYKFTFHVPGAYHKIETFSEDSNRRAWGASLHFAPQYKFFFFEMGADYTMYRSRFGGLAREWLFFAGPGIDLSFGKN